MACCLHTCSLKTQLVRTVLVRVVAMPGNPFLLDLVVLSNLVELIPQVLVQNRLAVGPDPAVSFPPRKELRNSFLQVLRDTHEAHGT